MPNECSTCGNHRDPGTLREAYRGLGYHLGSNPPLGKEEFE